ncbi:MAG: signal peptidase I [Candidatus Blackburnbacteria bacterium]|nr:signal peptidase I [Candidatus Blackburnbacteria bacterium]
MWLWTNWPRVWKVVITTALVVLIALPLTFYSWIAQPFQARGASMAPTLKDGQRFFVNKIAYKNDLPQRGDIVVFKNPQNPDKELVKRITGLPNEQIKIQNGQVYINDGLYREFYLMNGDGAPTYPGKFLEENKTFSIPADQYFVMGDDREHSLDSRDFGLVPKTNIVGQYWFKY